MKILKTGTIPDEPARWWLEAPHPCPHCGTVYQLEPDDPVDVNTVRSLQGTSTATSFCPLCGWKVETVRPNLWSALAR